MAGDTEHVQHTFLSYELLWNFAGNTEHIKLTMLSYVLSRNFVGDTEHDLHLCV